MMNKKRTFGLSLFVLVFFLPLWTPMGCKKAENTSAGGKRTIAVIPKGTMHAFWKSIEAGAKKAGEDYDVEIVWKGPLREDDREDQIKVMEDMITRGVDGIVLAPLDDTALKNPVRNAVRMDIPVVIIDSALQGDDYTSFVATDNYAGGVKGAHELARQLEEKGNVIMIRYQEGSGSTMNREQGFIDAIEEYPEINLVSDDQYGGADVEGAQSVSENLLASLEKDGELQVDGVFAPNESAGFGMLRALQTRGHAGKVKYVCFDTAEPLVTALEKGEISALIAQRPVYMAYKGVETLLKSLEGEDVPKRIDSGSVVVNRENMDDPEIQVLLDPLEHVDAAVQQETIPGTQTPSPSPDSAEVDEPEESREEQKENEAPATDSAEAPEATK